MDDRLKVEIIKAAAMLRNEQKATLRENVELVLTVLQDEKLWLYPGPDRTSDALLEELRIP